MENKYSRDLAHWAIGDMFKKHKYIAREETGTKDNGKPIYRYFYDNEKWKAFKYKAQSAINNFADTWKAGTNIGNINGKIKKAFYDFSSNWKAGINTSKINKIKKDISNGGGEFAKCYKLGLSQIRDSARGLYYRSALASVVNGLAKDNKGDTVVYRPIHGIFMAPKDSKFKYVGKIVMPNGKTRYCYTYEEFKRASEIYQYQINEPKFMSKIKEIDSDHLESKNETASKINPGYGEDGNERGINCQFCTLSYELRRRGYDVYAPNKASTSTPANDVFSTFGINVKQSTKTKTIKMDKDTYENTKTVLDANPELKKTHVLSVAHRPDGTEEYSITGTQYDSYIEDSVQGIKSVDIYEALKDSGKDPIIRHDMMNADEGKVVCAALIDKLNEFPIDSRGALTIRWAFGGHSIVWEKDSRGNVIVRDTQSDQVLYDAGVTSSIIQPLQQTCRYLSVSSEILAVRYDDKNIVSDDILQWFEEMK